MHYALPGYKKYPIETEEQVKLAHDYFTKYLNKFYPVDRAVIASNLEKRASDLQMDLDGGWIRNYSRREGYSPDFNLHMKMRKEACVGRKIKIDEKEIDAQSVLEKVAEQKDKLKPGEMMVLVADFDKKAGLENMYDRRLRDPVFTVFGSQARPNFDQVKLAEGITEESLKKLVRNEDVLSKLASTFGDGFVTDFKSDPVSLFKSMPAPEKEVISGIVKTAAVTREGQGVGGPRQQTGGTDTAKCPKCGYETKKERGVPASEMKCPKCGAQMVGK